MSAVEDLSSDEQEAYNLITSEDGLLQSQLWKELDANSRKGSRLARSLADKGLIERKETVSGGRTTYLLKPIDREHPSTQDIEETLEDEEESPEAEPDDNQALRERALSLVQETGGIYQSEFWKELDVSSRKGSRLATDLEEEDLIRREEAVYNGQRTYLLLPDEGASRLLSVDGR